MIRGTRSDMEAGPVKRQGEAVPMAVAVGTASDRRTRRWVGDERVGVRRDVSLICAGWLPQDGLFDVSGTAV
jgi:hypothetical protein